MGCMAYTVREETDMKIPASKVPAQVWADKAAKRDDLNYAEVECLGKWGSSKQVYRVDSTLWNELAADDGVEMPTVVFEKLPYDCVFIQRGGTSRIPSSFGTLERERAGYFCWVENGELSIGILYTSANWVDERGGRTSETGIGWMLDDYVSIPLRQDMTIAEYIERVYEGHMDENAPQYQETFSRRDLSDTAKMQLKEAWRDYAIRFADDSEIRQLLGTLMYISSKEADVRTVYAPQKNQSRKSRQTDCTVHDVGFRIAPQLAEVRRVYEHDAKGQDGGKTGRYVAPHVRRGHWHGYWTGPRENPTGLEIKWVAPTIVNGSRGELEGTVHEVGDRDGRYTLKSTQRECGRAAEQLNGAGRSEEQARDGKSDR